MLKLVDGFLKIFSENIARSVDRKGFFKIMGAGIFMSMVTVVSKSPLAYAAPGSWAEVCQLLTTSCSPPYGDYCTSGCKSGIRGSNRKCPVGFSTSFAWGYQSTGCWCINRATIMCCDCTEAGNSPYRPNPGDCGCKHYVD